jgi:hypothetical protein
MSLLIKIWISIVMTIAGNARPGYDTSLKPDDNSGYQTESPTKDIVDIERRGSESSVYFKN